MAHAACPPALPPVDILLIEDNPADVRLFREALKAGNISGQLSILENASAVVAFVQHEPVSPQLIVLDGEVPGMSVEELIESLRTLPGFANIPVLLFSSLDEREGQWRSALYGAMGFVHKPGDLQSYFDAILTMVRSGVEQRASLTS